MSAERNVLVLAAVVHSLDAERLFFNDFRLYLRYHMSLRDTTLALVIAARKPPASHYSSVVSPPVHALRGVYGVHAQLPLLTTFSCLPCPFVPASSADGVPQWQ